MTKKRKRTLLIVGAVVIVVAMVVGNLLQSAGNGIEVQADTVTREDLKETVSASGRIQPRTKVEITSEINGEIVALPVKEGDQVEMGELLVVLDTVQLRSDADQARYALAEVNARLDGAETALEQAREDFELQESLLAKKHTSEIVHRNARYALKNAESTFEAAKAQARQARSRYEKQLDNLRKAKIVAPMAGVVTYLDCEVGEIAPAQTVYSQGKILMVISNLDVFEVEVEVDETEINKVDLAQEASIEVDAYPDTTFRGRVVEVGNTAITAGMGTTEQSTNFMVRVVFEDPEVKLRPGMSATVDITTAVREDALSIPYSAVVMRSYDLDSLNRANASHESDSGLEVGEVHAAEAGDSIVSADSTGGKDEDEEKEDIKGVFVIREGEALFVPIETGIADQRRIEITSGLQEGDSVVSGPYRVLRTINHGKAVEVQNRDRDNGESSRG